MPQQPTRILITGATSGIGRELALQYAAQGVTLGLVGRRQELLDEVAEACRARGAQAHTYTQDVRDAQAMRGMIDDFLERAGGADLVIANAGAACPDRVSTGDPAPLTTLFDINVNGVLNTIVPFVPAMRAQGGGHLVAIASVAGVRPLPGHATYAATKVAVRFLMDGFGYSLDRWGIRATTINPGFVVSEMTDKNQFPMPFMLTTEDACRRIRRAIARRKRVYSFPLPMRFATWTLTFLPRWVVARIRT